MHGSKSIRIQIPQISNICSVLLSQEWFNYEEIFQNFINNEFQDSWDESGRSSERSYLCLASELHQQGSQ